MAVNFGQNAFTRLPGVTRGILWMMLAAFFYAALYIGAREASRDLPVTVVALIRSALVAMLMLPLVLRHGPIGLRTTQLKKHALRSAFLYGATILWIYALVHMTVADVTAIQFSTPLFTVILTALFLGERAGPRRWAALIVGFLGVLLILRPGFAEVGLPALAAVGCSSLFSASHTTARFLGRTDNAHQLVFFCYGLMVPIALVPALIDWVTPSWHEMAWIFFMAVVTLLAQQGLGRALIAAPPSVVMPITFMQLPFVSLMALALYGELSDIWTWIGAAVIFTSTSYIARRESLEARRRRKTTEAT